MQSTRKLRKEEQVKPSGTRYNSPRTLGKAVVKVKPVPRKLTDEGKKQIYDFYDRDDINRQMPGRKDVKTVKSNMGVKLRIQKRTMIMNIREAFEIFKET
ncbi:hypothetical protein TNCT_179411 [Trichonephila clavata]|uniref:Uncharacterized protein n=1 Tax=Trichonephila clavata TaxID=2740835 RepID=A0A8X6HXM7_TRICU|nr:hypothetical protein TNCT_179411 [Trichonephila clavata]